MIIRVTLKTENFSASAFDAFQVEVVNLDAITTVDASAKLIVSMNGGELLRDLFFVSVDEFSFKRVEFVKKTQYGFVENGTIAAHASHERIGSLDGGFEMAFPTLYTESMGTNIDIKLCVLGAAYITGAN